MRARIPLIIICGIASLSFDMTDFGCADVGANTVTLTSAGVNGNSASIIVTVTPCPCGCFHGT
jgi:hypothetical protein